jgi:hypothetical protein
MAITNTLTPRPSGAVRANPVHYPATFQFARQADVIAYASLDALGNAGGTSMEFVGAVRNKGGTARLKKVTLMMSGTMTPANMRVIISSGEPSIEVADNTAFAVAASDFPGVLANLQLPSSTAISGSALSTWTTSIVQETILQAAAGSRSIFATVVFAGAMTPVSAGLVTVILELAQD